MGTKFSEDIVPLRDLKVNPGKVVSQAQETHRPILLTSRGRGVAVVRSLKDYEEETEERAFMQGVMKGLGERSFTRLFESFTVTIKTKCALFESGEEKDS